MKELKYVTDETPEFLKMIMESIRKILVDVNEHPSTKLKCHKVRLDYKAVDNVPDIDGRPLGL